ncbi:hypothetical protein SQW19_13515 [Stenotrophomonas acidaminiphila]|uniref:DUF7668 domain-containing protein n=1 Tax=Stenotrophomonas acidaminiphila TaxID=128780 RepID=UPI002ABE2413|nr:hypothetical protein [Stenotrophomonas acidaminiphila]WPU55350.1 hypothetical protein SQW19_13515 [Stenotrophomonas acidaminiphila]
MSDQRAIPEHWRPTFREIVSAFVAGEYGRAIPAVEPISTQTAVNIQRYIRGYGATLAALPEDTWKSSVCMPAGDHWDAFVDLWTKEEGRSDLVLHAQVFDSPAFSVKVHLVYVP